MRRNIPFDEIMKDSNNWDDRINIDAMNENYHVLKHIISKFYFREDPLNPKLFSLVFSHTAFGIAVLNAIEQSRIKMLDRVYFCEYTKEDKYKLASMGILNNFPAALDIPAVMFTKAENTLFVCIFP